MRRRSAALVLLVVTPAVVLIATAGCSPAFRECDAVPTARLDALPARLSETGLFAPGRPETPGEGVRAFTPRYPLWTDGASKRRWIRLPPGTRIDTSDPDAWGFPRGTRVWKEFARDGVRVETRMLEKFGDAPDAWTPVAYVWRDDGEAYASPEGATNARATPHDVPSAAECGACHGGASVLLGFSAIQLPLESDEGWSLASLAAEGFIDAPPRPYDPPGDEATQRALGYLHANCGHCHRGERAGMSGRSDRSGSRCFDPESEVDFVLRIGEIASPESTATYRTAVGSVIDPGSPETSEVMERLHSRDPWWGMPALGTEQVDPEGARAVEHWIRGLR